MMTETCIQIAEANPIQTTTIVPPRASERSLCSDSDVERKEQDNTAHDDGDDILYKELVR